MLQQYALKARPRVQSLHVKCYCILLIFSLCLVFNGLSYSVAAASNSQPILDPIPLGEFSDTLTLCLGQTYSLNLGFEGAYVNQQIALDWMVFGYAGGLVIDSVTEGSAAQWQATIVANEENVGFNSIVLTGSDMNLPDCASTISIFYEVLSVTPPPLLETDTLILCSGFQNLVEAAAGYDTYEWNDGCQSAICQFNEIGLYVVTGQYQGCTVMDSVVALPSPVEECWLISANSLCPGELATIAMCDGVAEMTTTFDWEVLGDSGGLIVEDQDSVVWVTAGSYHFMGYSLTGCHHNDVFQIAQSGAFFPEDEWSQDYCSLDEEVIFEGASELTQNGYFNLGLNSTTPEGWNGDTLNLYVNGVLIEQMSPLYTYLQNYETVAPGDYIELEFIGDSGLSEYYGVLIYDCEYQDYTVIQGPFTNGEIIWSQPSACQPEPVEGVWQVVSGPEGGIFSNSETFNTSFNVSEWGEYQVCFMYNDCPELSPCYSLNFNGCIVWGCTDHDACNYDPDAEEDDGSCEYLALDEISGPTEVLSLSSQNYSYPYTEGYSYDWDVSSGYILEFLSPTEIVVNWTSILNGQIDLEVTDPDGCYNTTTLTVYFSAMSIESTSQLDCHVYPIPANEQLFLQISSDVTLDGLIQIVDITGKTVWSNIVQKPETINCFSWPAGIYMVMIQSQTGFFTRVIEVIH